MAVMAGLRQGELTGLKWDDIDWFNGQIRVKHTYNHGRFFEPKSETSKRATNFSPIVITELKKCQLSCKENIQNTYKLKCNIHQSMLQWTHTDT